MIEIDNILLDEEIANAPFSCNLSKCKGGCCTFPGKHGAPVFDNELEDLEKALPAAMEYLSERSINYIKKKGFLQGEEGKYTTRTIDDKDCVFVYFDKKGVALCALQAAYMDGKTDFIKPLSCHLFPIRIGNFAGSYLYYEKFDVCRPAIPHGKKTGTKVYQEAKEGLIRAFGEEWYDKLVEVLEKED